jgi:hypothetical protein
MFAVLLAKTIGVPAEVKDVILLNLLLASLVFSPLPRTVLQVFHRMVKNKLRIVSVLICIS